MKKFVNFTGINSEFWSKKQDEASRTWGLSGREEHFIVDIPFPRVLPEWGHREFGEKVEEYLTEIMKYGPSFAAVEGELSFSYSIIQGLVAAGVQVLKPLYGNGVFLGFREYDATLPGTAGQRQVIERLCARIAELEKLEA